MANKIRKMTHINESKQTREKNDVKKDEEGNEDTWHECKIPYFPQT